MWPRSSTPRVSEHVAVDAEQVLAVEAPLLRLLERAARLGHACDRHAVPHSNARRRASRALAVGAWERLPTGCARSGGRCSATGRRSASRCGAARRWFEELEAEIPTECPACGGEMLHRCPACSAPFSSTFAVDCEECGGRCASRSSSASRSASPDASARARACGRARSASGSTLSRGSAASARELHRRSRSPSTRAVGRSAGPALPASLRSRSAQLKRCCVAS